MSMAVVSTLSVASSILHSALPRRAWVSAGRLLWSSTNRRAAPKRRLLVRAARMESKAVPLASRAPDFQLPEPLTGNVWKLDDFEGYPALLVMFISNHCPFVIHLKKDIVKLANDYMRDGPELMAKEAKQFEFPFPYLYDEPVGIAIYTYR